MATTDPEPPSSTTARSARPRHFDALDGLRGSMALIVLTRHCFNAVNLPDATRLAVMRSPLALLQSGQAALHIFFVLSAFVLCQSIERDRSASGVVQYSVRRIFRLHPPYVVGLSLTWLASFFYRAAPASEPWVQSFAGVHLSPWNLLSHFTFPGGADMQMPVGWSLQVEMICSLLLPAFVWLGGRGRGLPLLALGAAAVALDPEIRWLRFGVDFAIGVVLYEQRGAVGAWFARRTALVHALIVATGWFLFMAPMLLGWTHRGLGLVLAGFDRRSVAVLSLAAGVIVPTCMWVPAMRRLFSWRPLVLLGHWAYGIYMFHLAAVVLLVPHFPAGLFSYALLCATVTATVVPVAAVFHYGLERPFMRLGSRVCAAYAGRAGTRVQRTRAVD